MDFFFALAIRRCCRDGSESGSRKWVKVSVSLNKTLTLTHIHIFEEGVEKAQNDEEITSNREFYLFIV